ncbi:tRNA dihydrouridine(20/20a) synthase DusA [Mycoplana sp. MJR14]|uniref:tRNA dihydrouridine(20/20a) synthase DusA n=1 Tax=Mycoplana sp. MJR14 TaxID=3032583 RepID=UPI0023DCD90E|nr:tRNA dihydrouridine(20/20a) synthase DusA [Mycoplana sp. MJR14]MDF1633918.1 tRNA dihydrouridine(20/20a) synthase DusA [Mycoplana sp. MJR14]
MYHKARKTGTKLFATAPMIDWSDRHYRYFARQLTKNAVLYTEMIVADAILRGNRDRLLGYDAVEHPLALQLGGSDPAKLAAAARIGAEFGYDEINLNVGCPSDRVQSGTFGACLMREPQLVADCVAAMKAAVTIPVTVKCRIGVDDQDPNVALRDLVARIRAAGVDAVWVHARKAWLQGLSPKENRDIPPLDYGLVRRLKAENPDLFVGLNGGLHTLDQALAAIGRPGAGEDRGEAPDGGRNAVSAEAPGAAPGGELDGAMLGRAAYQDSGVLAGVDTLFSRPDIRTLDAATPPQWERSIAAGAGGTLPHRPAGEEGWSAHGDAAGANTADAAPLIRSAAPPSPRGGEAGVAARVADPAVSAGARPDRAHSAAAHPDAAFWAGVRDAMTGYAEQVMAGGGRLNHVTRHMVGLFQGFPGARRYRQILSADATRPGAGPEVIEAAFAAVLEPAAARQAAE